MSETEVVSLKSLSKDAKIYLLQKLGYDSDGTYVKKEGKNFKDIYTKQIVKLDNMIILPGSTIILDNNPLSIASYMEEYGDGIF